MDRRKMVMGGLLNLACALAFAVLLIANPLVAFAEGSDKATISVENATASPGDTVDVSITVKNNPGILGATLEVSFDNGLTLTNASNGEALSMLTMTKPGTLTSPCRFTWDGMDLNPSDVRDGTVLKLTFKVGEGVEPDSDLTVSVTGANGAVLDGDLNAIDVTYKAGTITVTDYNPGDLDGDGVVNSRDVIYARRHIVGGYEQTINVAAADVNDDLVINSADVILMRRYIAGGYGVKLKPSRLKPAPSGDESCTHNLEATAAKNPTCTAEGNFAYWQCKKCHKYFSDAEAMVEVSLEDTKLAALGHTPVVDAAVAPTHTSTGLTEGSHCSVCDEVLVPQIVLPPLEADEYYITYDVANGDSYLAGLSITNPNKTSYYEGDSFKLSNLSAPGYRFLGWYDGAGDDSTKITRIEATSAEDLELYAHWQVINYQVQFESDLFLDTNSATYTVDSGLVLPTPKLSNYVFVGWSDEDGELYGKRIPVGTTGNITLKANWTSERNKTYTNPNPSDPIIYEDEDSNVIVFAYEIGRIENVPLYTIKDFGYISGDGVTRSATETYSAKTEVSTAETISNVVANATTNSSNWTLSSGWNETTSISEEWCEAHGYTKQEAETIAKSDSENWNVSNSSYGSSSTTSTSSSADGWTNDVKVNKNDSSSGTIGGSISVTDGWKNAAELNAGIQGGRKVGVDAGLDDVVSINGEKSFGWNVGGKVAGEQSHSTTGEISGSITGTSERGIALGGSQTHMGTSSSSSTNTSGWNNSSSYGGSSTTSKSNTVSTAVSNSISQKKGYGKSYVKTGSETQGLATSSTNTQTDGYTAATTWNTETSEGVTSSWTTAATKPGYHRWIVAGTAHVYGVVGYDINTKAFFVYTYSVMDDETHEFEDYSYTSSAYNDNENGVISFEVPYDEVMDEVGDRVFSTEGLRVDLETGTIVSYTGTDTCVIIPEYYNAGNGDVVKITGISESAFAGNTDIVTVVLSDFVTEIPENAFNGCTSLVFVNGKGVTSIGKSAFAGCTSLEDCGIYSRITYLGESAFQGADRLYANASNKDVARAAIASGAKGLVLNLRFLEDDEEVLSDVTFAAPSSMDYFELNGDGRTFKDLSIDSEADETLLNKVNITSVAPLPVKLSSSKVILNQSSISSTGISLALLAEETQVGLRGTTTISSTSQNAMLCKNVNLYETASDVVGKLVVPQKLLLCGAMSGRQFIQYGSIETIDETTFSALLTPTTVYFDAGEGTCDEESRPVVYGAAIGELPIPTRGYCTFDGWYIRDSNTRVTESTVLPVGQDTTLDAHWIKSWATDVSDGWYTLQASVNRDYSVDVRRSTMTNVSAGNEVRLYATNYTVAQQFKFVQNDDDTYTIWHLVGNLAIGVGSENENGQLCVELKSPGSSDDTKWYIERTTDGYFSFRNKGNNLYLDMISNQMTEQQLLCRAGDGSANQKFRMRESRYALYDVGDTWSQAKALCEQLGGHLATVTSASEEAKIDEMLTGRALEWQGVYQNCYWLGGYRQGTTWKWVTGESFSYSNWAPGQPDNNGDEDRLMTHRVLTGDYSYRSLKWNDYTGYTSSDNEFYNVNNFGFIIEWEDEESGITTQSADEEAVPTEIGDDEIQVQSDESEQTATDDEEIQLGNDEELVVQSDDLEVGDEETTVTDDDAVLLEPESDSDEVQIDETPEAVVISDDESNPVIEAE